MPVARRGLAKKGEALQNQLLDKMEIAKSDI